MLRKFALLCCALFAAPAAIAPAHATESGGGVYPLGAEGALGGALPPPGVYYLGYLQNYEANRFNDGKGDKGLLPDFHVDAQAAVTRLVWVTDRKVLGADFAMHIVAPLVAAQVRVGGVQGQQTGFTDVTIDPFILGWHWKNGLHVITGIDVNVPIGRYDRTNPATVSRHYWNVEPIIALAYTGRKGLQVDVKTMFDINFANPDAQINGLNPTGARYRSGNEFHLEYAVTQAITPRASLGVAGYYYVQTSSDRVNDASAQRVLDALDGFKGEAVAAGPTLRVGLGKAQLIGTWQHEFTARYRPQGDKLWLKLILPVGH